MQSKLYKNLCPKAASKILKVDIIIAITAVLLLPSFLKWNPK
jgi:hypothetical protein